MTFFISSFRLGIGGCDPTRGREAPFPRGVWGHSPPENFEIWKIGNAISSILGIKKSAVDDVS